MASLSKHGQNIQIEFLTTKKAYCSDGKILKNYGSGWKLWGKLKPGFDWQERAQMAKDNQKQYRSDHPAWAEFIKLVIQYCPSLKKRVYVMTGLEMCSNDPDGLYIDLDDNYETSNYLTFDDVNQLCKAYDQAQEEKARLSA